MSSEPPLSAPVRARARGTPGPRGSGYPQGRVFAPSGSAERVHQSDHPSGPISPPIRARGMGPRGGAPGSSSPVDAIEIGNPLAKAGPPLRGAARARPRGQVGGGIRGDPNRRSLPVGREMSQTSQPPPIPSLPPPDFPCECEALFDCAADTENEISFSKGDIVIIIAKPYPDWWMAKSDSKEGLVPANYL